MATAGSIVVDLLMRTGSFETDAKRAAKQIDKLTKDVTKYAKRAALAGTAMAGTLVAMMKNTSQYMADMGTTAERTSVTVEAFSELAYAADRASLSQGELQRILRRSTEAINHLLDGTSKQAQLLQELGISAYDASGRVKTADQMLKDLAERFSKLEPGARKTRLAIELFGSQLGQKVLPLLNQGADGMQQMADRARKLGLVLDDEAVKAATEFQNSLDDLGKRFKGLQIQLGQQLIPAANDFISVLSRSREKSDDLLSTVESLGNDQSLPDWIDLVGSGLAHLADVVVALGKMINAVHGSFKSVAADIKLVDAGFRAEGAGWIYETLDEKHGTSLAPQVQAEYQDALNERNKIVEKANQDLWDLWNYDGAFYSDQWTKQRNERLAASIGPPAPRNLGKPPKDLIVDPDDPPRRTTGVMLDDGQRLIDQMIERIALLGKETEAERLLARISVGAVSFRTQEQQDFALALAQTHDVMLKAEEDAAEFQALMHRLFPEQAQAQHMAEDIDVLTTAFEAGKLSADEFALALDRLQDADREDFWGRYTESLERAMADFDTLAGNTVETFTRGFGDALSSIIMDVETLDQAFYRLFDGMARSLIGALGEMAAQWLVYQGVQMLVGKATQASAAGAMMASASAQSLQAGLAAYASTAAIPVTGPAEAPAAMASAIAATSPMVSAIGAAALSGMAHDGIDSIPKTGTWLLEKGERVLTSETSARLDALLERVMNLPLQGAPRQDYVTQPPQITLVINTQDADSFRRSRTQIEREMALAAQRALARS
ncbi:hypothetical protein [Orrella sp. 11846]|uniref:hypothetical protein n=1 Tax=Orrella sp. 11846 TaxID=3409913 RepID=UPI003B5C53DD